MPILSSIIAPKSIGYNLKKTIRIEFNELAVALWRRRVLIDVNSGVLRRCGAVRKGGEKGGSKKGKERVLHNGGEM